MNKLLLGYLLAALLVSSITPAFADTQQNELPECVVITHCVRENWESSDVENLFKKALEAVVNTPRTKIVEQTDSYIHAEAKTRWRRYTDDLLLKALPERGILQVRSESRVGVGDNGVNQKRLEDLAYRLMTDQTQPIKKLF